LFELDAASFTGVENIKDLLRTAQLAPHQLQKRVFILDEAHMLSQSAFNALLKTLEEPPAHSCFILATTELHKIPLTVQSRCQTFRFEAFSFDELRTALQSLLSEIESSVDEDVLNEVCQSSSGSLRDALTLLETLGLQKGHHLSRDSLQNFNFSLEKEAQDLFFALDQGNWTSLFQSLSHCEKKKTSWSNLLKALNQKIHEAFMWSIANRTPSLKPQLFPDGHIFEKKAPQTSPLLLSQWFQSFHELLLIPSLTKEMVSLHLSLLLQQNETKTLSKPSASVSPKTSQDAASFQNESALEEFFRLLDSKNPLLSSRLKNLKIRRFDENVLEFLPCEKNLFDQIKKTDQEILDLVRQTLNWKQKILGLNLRDNDVKSWQDRQKQKKEDDFLKRSEKVQNRPDYQMLKKELQSIQLVSDD
jgi:DNA polymerase-3 subunit gamma/tau